MSNLPNKKEPYWTGWYISVAVVLLFLIIFFYFFTQQFA
jgi:hypothetical protein